MKTLEIKELKGSSKGKGAALLTRTKQWLKNESSDETSNKVSWTYIGLGMAVVVLVIMYPALKSGTFNVSSYFTSITGGAKSEPSGWSK
ncbi:TPA: hypothetical protein ACGXQA_005944 [Bacillus mobilis]|uniref:hypothetical protein n=1 Tax=Bacillus cereus TaxID=1396 RepID=UPI001F10DEB5|nr:hypothetical protein [Bacillus cereus]MCH5460877.1 hypothetical protein [Bacillus cereus]